MSTTFANNIRYLRKQFNLSQQKLSDLLEIPRTTWNGYELGKTEPNIEMLIRLSEHFKVNIDSLLTKNLRHEDMETMRNDDLRILAISVDSDDRQNIELVDARAEAGYLESFQDPEYIRELPKLHIPQLPQGSFRAFEIRGESMLPLEPGSIVICEYVEKLSEIKNNKTYVIATHMDGLVYKRLLINKDKNALIAQSDNPNFAPYQIEFKDIAEIWQYHAHLSFSDVRKAMDQWLGEHMQALHNKVDALQKQLEERKN